MYISVTINLCYRIGTRLEKEAWNRVQPLFQSGNKSLCQDAKVTGTPMS